MKHVCDRRLAIAVFGQDQVKWNNVKLIFLREVRDQLRDRRTLFMITILPVLLYPMLGLGIVEMLLTFREKERTVVILNAQDLPQTPAFLNDGRIDPEWFSKGKADADRLRVITDLPKDTDDQPVLIGRQKPDAELLDSARTLADRFNEFQEALDADAARARLVEIQDRLSQSFTDSGIQVLVIVPDGYAQATAQLQQDALATADNEDAADLPLLHVIRNSADDKSVVAFGRIRSALLNWEDALRSATFAQASLRTELQHPARLEWVELAQGEEVSANVWSKLFPAMIVIMALTGAFYPAIDLGAGEKERGTMETVLISPASRIELVMGKFCTIVLFSMSTALMNLLSMGFSGQHMASAMGGGVSNINLQFPPVAALMWLLILLVPLAALFSALCLALATFAKSTKEGQYYLTPLLMVILGLTMFCLNPGIEITPLYSVLPVVNVALLLKGMLLSSSQSTELIVYAVPVLISSFGYSALALWWAIDLYKSEGVLFREAEKFDLKLWFMNLTRDKEPVPAFQESVFCFVILMFLHFVAMNYLKPDLTQPDAGQRLMQTLVIQQLTMIACPAVFMGLLLTTSLRATFRLRMPKLSSLLMGIGLAVLMHPISIEMSMFVVQQGILPPAPAEGLGALSKVMAEADPWLVITVFALTPAICEELAFRGFILSGLARGGRLKVAIIMSSLMFGIFHLIPQQAFNAAIVGLLIGLIAVHSRSIFPAIAFHLVSNTIALFHSRNGFGINPDGVFMSTGDGMLRYELPMLIICSIGIGLMVIRLVRDLQEEQKARREDKLRSFEAPPEPNNLAAGI